MKSLNAVLAIAVSMSFSAGFLSIIQVQAEDQLPLLGPLAKNQDGSVRWMSSANANQYCIGLGSRLPTARELAFFAAAHGARPIRETAYPGKNFQDSEVQAESAKMEVDNYFMVTNSHNTVAFYTSVFDRGYQPLWVGEENQPIWSSTTPGDDNNLPAYRKSPYFLDRKGWVLSWGNLDSDTSVEGLTAVRCVLSP